MAQHIRELADKISQLLDGERMSVSMSALTMACAIGISATDNPSLDEEGVATLARTVRVLLAQLRANERREEDEADPAPSVH